MDSIIDKKIFLLHSQEQEQRAKERALKFGFFYLNMLNLSVELEDIGLISEKEARHWQAGVIARTGKLVKLGVIDPTKTETIVKKFTQQGYRVKLFVISPRSLEKIIRAYQELPKETSPDKISISHEETKQFSQLRSADTLKEAIRNHTASDMLSILLAGGIYTESSDIHLEPSEDEVRIRFRVDGFLEDITSINRKDYSEILSRIKVLSKLKLNIASIPQNGRFTITSTSQGIARRERALAIDIRVSTLPGPYGETVVMRLLNPRVTALVLDELGLNVPDLILIKREIKKSNGMLLVTGPTGSGKTTTLYAALTEIHHPGLKIITLEDPIEYRLGGIVQTQINEKEGYTFEIGLKNTLRQDPDVILVGEIRDKEGGATALNAALTGHLVFSTLHTNDSFGAIPRLIELGINPVTIGPAINLIIAQRLVRKICVKCNGKKCLHCRETGYKGRIGIFELLLVDDEMEELIISVASPSISEIKKLAIRKGTKTMRQDGLEKVRAGIITMEELERVSSQ